MSQTCSISSRLRGCSSQCSKSFLGGNETVCFSTVLCVTQSAAEGREEWSTGGCGGPFLAKPALVSPAGVFIDRETSASVSKIDSPSNACGSKYGASDEKKKQNTTTTYLQNNRCRLRNRGLLQHAASVVCSSWRAGTLKLYSVYIRKWKVHARKRGIDPVHTAVTEAVNFL